jgi:hypothetical protein
MSWLSVVNSVIAAAFPPAKKPGVEPPPGLKGARVSYTSEGRSGRVIFSRGLQSFAMYFEFGGGDVLASISIPSVKAWEKETGYSLHQRDAILNFIGQCVVKDQTTKGTGRFEIEDEWINIYS